MLERSAKVRLIALIALIAASFLLAGAADAWSQQPPLGQSQTEQQPEGANQDQQEPKADQESPTATTPLSTVETSVETDASSETDNGGANEQSNWWWQFWYDIRITDAIIALFTALLFASTVYLYRATKRSADAAFRTAEHMQTVERAWIIASIRRDDADGGSHMTHTLWLTNHGKTPGTIKTIQVDYSLGEPPPQIPHYDAPKKQVYVVLGAGESHSCPLTAMLNPTFVWGCVRYGDVFGQQGSTNVLGFCFRVDPANNRIEAGASHPDWTYERTEKTETYKVG